MDDNSKKTIESYDKTVDDYIALVDPLQPKNYSDKFLTFLKNEDKILDLGCGPGRDAKVFVEAGMQVVGVDLSEKMIEAAKKRVPKADFRVMNILNLDFTDDYFEGIWASAIFIHIPKSDIGKALKESYRVLKQDGIIYISLKKGEGEGLEPDERYGGVEKYWSFFTEEEIFNELKIVGFKILDINTVVKDAGYATNPWINIFCKK